MKATVIGLLEQLKAGESVTKVFEEIGKTARSTATDVVNLYNIIKRAVEILRFLDEITSSAEKWNEAFWKGINAIKALFQNTDWSGIWDGIVRSAQDLWTRVQAEFNSLVTSARSFFQRMDFPGIWDGIVTAATNLSQSITQQFNDILNSINSLFANWSWSGMFDGILAEAWTIIDLLKASWTAFKAWLNSLNPFAGPQPKTPSPQPSSGSASEFAGGGFVRGPGSTTSDSILAWLSNNEYVVRASAVRHYGLGLMEAINSMRLPKDAFRGFSLGGLVMPAFPSPPRFAQGGLAMATTGQSRSLTLVLDGRSFAMSGKRSTIDDLEKAADLHKLARIGKAPSWVR